MIKGHLNNLKLQIRRYVERNKDPYKIFFGFETITSE